MDQSNQIEVYCDSANTTNKIVTIYGTKITVESLKRNMARLTNQIWKLIPMRENNEDWQKQINNVKLELIGLNAIFNFDSNYLHLLANLEALLIVDTEFTQYRSKVFESINLLGECCKNAIKQNRTR